MLDSLPTCCADASALLMNSPCGCFSSTASPTDIFHGYSSNVQQNQYELLMIGSDVERCTCHDFGFLPVP